MFAFKAIISALCLILLLQTSSSKPAGESSTAKDTNQQPAVNLEQLMNSGGDLLRNLGDLVSGLVTMGLKSASAFITSGEQARQQIAVAVGSAAIPSLFNVSRTLGNLQQNGQTFLNDTQRIMANSTLVRDVTTTFVKGISPALEEVSQAFQKAGRPAAPASPKKKIEFDIPKEEDYPQF